jgi:hypothetical protein
MDPDPGSRLTQQLSKNFNMIFLKEIRICAYLLMDPFMFFTV